MACRALQLGQSAWEHDMTGSATALGGKWQQTSILRCQLPLNVMTACGMVCECHSRIVLCPRWYKPDTKLTYGGAKLTTTEVAAVTAGR